ncbi:MAG: hypothetical protein NT062_17970, partial [Proteobacteria bacterium]|nr:hypothetical protein [Pseudomonadota bacterium]
PRDSLARAELARLVTYATDLDALVVDRLAHADQLAFDDDPRVVAIVAARTATPDLDPVAAVSAVIDAAGLRALCAAWGATDQRLANLDALRAHAVAYAGEALARRDAPSLVGLLAYLGEMAEQWGWQSSRSDHQALLGGSNAVTISTWHGAKGREWPITVLYGLETLREPVAFGLHVESDAPSFDLMAPLAGRWLRYWPNPYTTPNQLGAVKDAYDQSPEFASAVARAEREALRLLYVGWTRARDRLVLAAADGKLLGGLLGTLAALDASLISEPAGASGGDVSVTWAGRAVTIRSRPAMAAAPVVSSVTGGEITLGSSARPAIAARITPSAAAPVPCTIGEPITIGPRLTLRRFPDMEHVGHAVHGFLAADRPELDAATRRELAVGLLRRYAVDTSLDPDDVVACGARLWAWLASTGATRLLREWPISHRLADGALVAGTADLVVVHGTQLSLVDHKTFPGDLFEALPRLAKYSGQLALYVDALATTTTAPIERWIHLPILGVMAELRTPLA